MLRSLLLLALLSACADDEDTDKAEESDADTDTDTDADSDADTDADSDADADADPATYEEFVTAHARAYCGALETCSLLDEQGYADRDTCVSSVEARLNEQECPSYQPSVATMCIQADRDMADRCADAGTGSAPPICRNICTPPEEGTPP
jgi:hypothetical protein